MTNKDVQQYIDFEIYSRALIESRDVDPVYPLVKSIIEHYRFEPEWFIFCYVAFYNLESVIKFCEEFPNSRTFDPGKFMKLRQTGKFSKFGHERRGSCRIPNNQVKIFQEGVDFVSAIHDHVSGRVESQFLDSNRDFRDNIESLAFHGSWAAFKIAELFEKSLDFTNLTIHDLGLDDKDPNRNDGPVGGLRWLYGREHEYNKDIYPVWNEFGSNLAKAWGVDMGEVETCLCKWHKMMSGKYWVGHDIAEFIELQHVMDSDIYQGIMGANFDDRMWKNLRRFPKEHRPVYRDSGKIINAEIAKKLPKIDVLQILLDT